MVRIRVFAPQQIQDIKHAGACVPRAACEAAGAEGNLMHQGGIHMNPRRRRHPYVDVGAYRRDHQQSEMMPDQPKRAGRRNAFSNQAVFLVMIKPSALRVILVADTEDDVGTGDLARIAATHEIDLPTGEGQTKSCVRKCLTGMKDPIVGHDPQAFPVDRQRVHRSGSHVAAGGIANPVIRRKPYKRPFVCSRQRCPAGAGPRRISILIAPPARHVHLRVQKARPPQGAAGISHLRLACGAKAAGALFTHAAAFCLERGAFVVELSGVLRRH